MKHDHVHAHLSVYDEVMFVYKQPKMIGRKVPFSIRLQPAQHRTIAERAYETGLSMAEYVGALVDREAGRPTALDNAPLQRELTNQDATNP